MDDQGEACVIHIVEESTDIKQKDANLEAIGMCSLDIVY
jgi:hypothetical protein